MKRFTAILRVLLTSAIPISALLAIVGLFFLIAILIVPWAMGFNALALLEQNNLLPTSYVCNGPGQCFVTTNINQAPQGGNYLIGIVAGMAGCLAFYVIILYFKASPWFRSAH